MTGTTTTKRRLDKLEARGGGTVSFTVRAVPCRQPGDPAPEPAPDVFIVCYPGGGLADRDPAEPENDGGEVV